MFRIFLMRGASAGVLLLTLTSLPDRAGAQEALPTIDVAGEAPGPGPRRSTARSDEPRPPLDTVAPTTSRLGLTQRQTPASVHAMRSEEMRERGIDQAEAVIATFPGVTFGNDPTSPASYSMRGFTNSQITVLRDGVYLGPAGFINRPSNAFNVESVEVLKGPSSLLNGQGAVGGIVNIRTKEPTFGRTRYEASVRGGSFGTVNLGAGVNAQLREDLAARLDISRNRSSGFVDNTPSDSLNLTASALWAPSEDLSVKLGMDFLHDNLSPYLGTPLVPLAYARSPMTGLVGSANGLVVDRDMRFKNYNVADSMIASTQIMPTARVIWKPTSEITITDNAYYFYADRKWQNAETFTFMGLNNGQVDAAGNPIPAGSIARDRFYVFHDQNKIGNTITATVDRPIFGFDNKFLVGADTNFTHFVRDRGFPNADYADYVDAWNPTQGSWGVFPGEYPIRRAPTRVDDYAGLFEDVLTLRPDLKLVTGARYEFERLDRVNYNQNGTFSATTSFRRNFHPFNFRVGLIYDVTRDVSVYGQYSTAKDPIGSSIYLVNASQNFDLSSSRQYEVGAKASFQDGKGEATLALYEIHRSNILSQTTQNTASNIGSQMSRGVEFATAFQIAPQWKVSLNAAYTYARYGFFYDPSTGVLASGNRPPNVPTWTANLWTTYSNIADLPLDVGFGLRFVDSRAGNNANTLFLESYVVADIGLTYHLMEGLDASVRVQNLFDESYVQWAQVSYPGQVLLGAPRGVTFGLAAKF
jgi:iron complex outermembrane receptor protein